MASLRIINSIPVLSLVFLSFALSEAKQVVVGGKDASWIVDSSWTLTPWAEKKRFRVGDQLKWKSDKEDDSVLQVTKDGYESCETSNPIQGNVSEITLDQQGPFCFISGVKEHCEKGLKLIVVVMSEKHKAAASPAQTPAAEPAAPPSNNGFTLSAGFMGYAIGLAGLLSMALT